MRQNFGLGTFMVTRNETTVFFNLYLYFIYLQKEENLQTSTVPNNSDTVTPNKSSPAAAAPKSPAGAGATEAAAGATAASAPGATAAPTAATPCKSKKRRRTR